MAGGASCGRSSHADRDSYQDYRVAARPAHGYITERQSERTISSIVARRQTARLVREGHPGEYPAEQVIPGDLLILTPGSYVCADARLIQSDNLSVDESSLTGESLPVRKSIATLDQEKVEAYYGLR